MGFDVHAINLPGHDNKAGAPEKLTLTVDKCVKYLQEYLQNYVNNPYVLVGMSMGGAVCQRLLCSGYHNLNLRGVVLLSSVPPVNNLTFSLRFCRNLAVDYSEILIDFFREKANPRLLFSSDSIRELADAKIKGYLGKILSGFPRLEYEIFFQDLIRTPFTVSVPMKHIGGEQDLLFPPSVIQFNASYYSHKAEIIDGLGHVLPLDSKYMKGINAMDPFLDEVFS